MWRIPIRSAEPGPRAVVSGPMESEALGWGPGAYVFTGDSEAHATVQTSVQGTSPGARAALLRILSWLHLPAPLFFQLRHGEDNSPFLTGLFEDGVSSHVFAVATPASCPMKD